MRANANMGIRARLTLRGMAVRASLTLCAVCSPALQAYAEDDSQGGVSPHGLYPIEGIGVGDDIVNSSLYRSLKCWRSEVFLSSTWCSRDVQGRGSHGPFTDTFAVLHSSDGHATYVGRVVHPAYLSSSEMDNEISRLSRIYHQKANILEMPRHSGFTKGVIASWGNITLTLLDTESTRSVAAGKSTNLGILVDFLGDYKRSALEGLPLYSLGGGAGAIWDASTDESGAGTLRLVSADVSKITPVNRPSRSAPIGATPSPIASKQPEGAQAKVTPSEAPIPEAAHKLDNPINTIKESYTGQTECTGQRNSRDHAGYAESFQYHYHSFKFAGGPAIMMFSYAGSTDFSYGVPEKGYLSNGNLYVDGNGGTRNIHNDNMGGMVMFQPSSIDHYGFAQKEKSLPDRDVIYELVAYCKGGQLCIRSSSYPDRNIDSGSFIFCDQDAREQVTKALQSLSEK